MMRFLNILAVLGMLFMLASCSSKRERVVTPYGSVLDSVTVTEEFDLPDIQTSGELIMATLSGPQTYYDYHGKQLGTQYLICQHFADSLGVRLRVEVCRDSIELARRLEEDEVDLVAWATPGHIQVGKEKQELSEEFKGWYRPSLIEEVRKEETALLTTKKVRRRVFSPMLDAKGGIVSHYDHYFMVEDYDPDVQGNIEYEEHDDVIEATEQQKAKERIIWVFLEVSSMIQRQILQLLLSI